MKDKINQNDWNIRYTKYNQIDCVRGEINKQKKSLDTLLRHFKGSHNKNLLNAYNSIQNAKEYLESYVKNQKNT